MATWIDLPSSISLSAGDVAFLIERNDANRRTTTLSASDRPAHTNLSHEPKLHGWCGSTNNVAKTAMGVVRVAKVTKNERAMVVRLSGADEAAALEKLGYPQLAG